MIRSLLSNSKRVQVQNETKGGKHTKPNDIFLSDNTQDIQFAKYVFESSDMNTYTFEETMIGMFVSSNPMFFFGSKCLCSHTHTRVRARAHTHTQAIITTKKSEQIQDEVIRGMKTL